MQQSSSRYRAINTAAITFLILLAGALYVWQVITIPAHVLPNAFLAVMLFCVALITVTLYQSMKIYESAHSLAQHLTKDMLLYSRELFTELYRGSPVPYIVVNDEIQIESMNFAAARLFHVELDALTGFDIFAFVEDGDDAYNAKIALIPEYFKQAKSVNDVEVEIRRPDGMLRWVMLSLFSFTDTRGEKKGLLTLVDITKQKLIDKAKTEFVSLASHQLRTPISGMKWNIELLLTAGKEHLTPMQDAYVDKISHSLERMDMLVNDFLSVSKFELGTLVPEFTQVDLDTFFESVLDEHTPMAEQKSVHIETVWPQDLGQMRSDSHLLHMITNNLLSNAIKYTPAGGVVRFNIALQPGKLVLTIADTGIGIPLEDQEMIFSKMFRASNARSQVADGTGLGLYIVKEAARILGGTVSFESKEGQGTAFTVVLPKQ